MAGQQPVPEAEIRVPEVWLARFTPGIHLGIIGGDAVLRARLGVGRPRFHGGVVFFQNFRFPAMEIKVPRNDDDGVPPPCRCMRADFRGEFFILPQVRHDHGNAAVRPLLGAAVGKPAAQELFRVGDKAHGFRVNHGVAGPPGLFPLRAVGGNVHEVGSTRCFRAVC